MLGSAKHEGSIPATKINSNNSNTLKHSKQTVTLIWRGETLNILTNKHRLQRIKALETKWQLVPSNLKYMRKTI